MENGIEPVKKSAPFSLVTGIRLGKELYEVISNCPDPSKLIKMDSEEKQMFTVDKDGYVKTRYRIHESIFRKLFSSLTGEEIVLEEEKEEVPVCLKENGNPKLEPALKQKKRREPDYRTKRSRLVKVQFRKKRQK